MTMFRRCGLSSLSASVIFAAGFALFSSGDCKAASAAVPFDLLDLQVFAKRNIQAQRSDFQGATAAGADIQLSDFAILGDLSAGNHIAFSRGMVSGSVAARSKALSQVNAGESPSVTALDLDLVAHQLDQLSARLANLPTTTEVAIYERAQDGSPVKHIDIEANRSLEVVELRADQFVAAWPGRVRVDIHGDASARLIVRVLGSDPRWRHVGFSLSGGIEPADIVFAFPQASALEISDSGGAVDPNGRSVGVPGSVVAPNASLQFASALVTGQVFARDILPIAGSPTGQVDRFGTVGQQGPSDASASPSAAASASAGRNRVLAQLDADLSSVRCTADAR